MKQDEMTKPALHLLPCHAFNLRQANLAVTALYNSHMQKTGLTIQQFSLLWHCKELGPLSITDISKKMSLDRTTVSRNSTLLIRKGLLHVHPSSGRQKKVEITKKGVEEFSQAYRAWQDAQQEIERKLGKEQMGQLEALLLKLIE